MGMNKGLEIIERQMVCFFLGMSRLQLKSYFNKMLNSVLLFLFRYCILSLDMLKSEWPVFTIFERTERNLKR